MQHAKTHQKSKGHLNVISRMSPNIFGCLTYKPYKTQHYDIKKYQPYKNLINSLHTLAHENIEGT